MAIEYPRPGWVQQDAVAIWQAVSDSVEECLVRAGSPTPRAIGISNQRETGLAWERATGRPIGPAVTWQCRRSADLCERLRQAGLGAGITARTGLPLDPMFTAGKLRWLLDARPGWPGASSDRGALRGYRGRLGPVEPDRRRRPRHGCQQRLAHPADGHRRGHLGCRPGRGLRGPRWRPCHNSMPSRRGLRREGRALGALPAGVPIGALVGDSHAALFGQGATSSRAR